MDLFKILKGKNWGYLKKNKIKKALFLKLNMKKNIEVTLL